MAIGSIGNFIPNSFCRPAAQAGAGNTQALSSAMVENYTEGKYSPWGSRHHDVHRRGYALDLNGDGRYNKGQDGVLAFDLNGDGKVSGAEVSKSRANLMALGGNYDFNADGKVSAAENRKGSELAQEVSRKYDLNQDGRLDQAELARGGARVMVDSNKDGRLQAREARTVFQVPTPGFGRSSLDYVNPYMNSASVGPAWGF